MGVRSIGPAGEFYLAFGGTLVEKYDAKRAHQWDSVADGESELGWVAAGADGSVYTGGRIVGAYIPGEQSHVVDPAIVSRLNSADGKPLWTRKWGCPPLNPSIGDRNATILYGAVAGNSELVISGVCNPGITPFAARYEPDGSRLWLKEYQASDVPSSQVLGDSTQYLAVSDSVLAIDPTGSVLNASSMHSWPAFDGRAIDWSANKLFVYSTDGFFYALSSDRIKSVARHAATQSAVLDSGVTWTGNFPTYSDDLDVIVRTTSEGVYLCAHYHNAPPSSAGLADPLFVGKYDFTGERIWFQEFVFEESPGIAPESENMVSLMIDKDENPVVMGYASFIDGAPTYVFALSKSDGQLLPP